MSYLHPNMNVLLLLPSILNFSQASRIAHRTLTTFALDTKCGLSLAMPPYRPCSFSYRYNNGNNGQSSDREECFSFEYSSTTSTTTTGGGRSATPPAAAAAAAAGNYSGSTYTTTYYDTE